MRVVFDTSTIIRGLTRRYSEPAYIIDKIADELLVPVMSDEMAKELIIAIYMMCDKANINPKKYLRAISTVILSAEKVKIKTRFTSCRDPDDNMVIECAINAGVNHCVASDPAIYDIKKYCTNQSELQMIRHINFYNPQAFYNWHTSNFTNKS